MRILIAADAWQPYISGQTQTFAELVKRLRAEDHVVEVITPYMFRTIPFPYYPSFRIPIWVTRKVVRMIEDFAPDAIHLATEGPVGCAAREWCVRHGFPFTTSYTTKIPEYLKNWFGLPLFVGYEFFRWFHGPASRVMISTASFHRELTERGFSNLAMWTRGVDTDLFRPRDSTHSKEKRPIYLSVGRVAREKNLSAFLDLPLEGTKVVVGDGPILRSLSKKYSDVRFVGEKRGEELARIYSDADVFVFPSRLDTFGLVLLEALASGTPVAAYPVTGPNDVIGNAEVGALDEDLAEAVRRALMVSREECRDYAKQFTWDRSVNQFLENLCSKDSQETESHIAVDEESEFAFETAQRRVG